VHVRAGGPFSAAVAQSCVVKPFVYNRPPYSNRAIPEQGGNQLTEMSEHCGIHYRSEHSRSVAFVDAEAAVRYDNYKTLAARDPKGSLKFQHRRFWLLRASVGSGFRAPSLTDCTRAQAPGQSNGTRDRSGCPDVRSPTPRPCNFQFSTWTGGQPEPEPEKNRHLTGGHGVRTHEGIEPFGCGVFFIYLTNAIVVGVCRVATIWQNAASARRLANLITRDFHRQFVSFISQTNANIFREDVSGRISI